MSSKNRIKHYLLLEKKNIVLCTLFCLSYVLCQIGQPFLLGQALDVAKDDNLTLFIVYLVVCLSLTLLGMVFYYLFEILAGLISQHSIKKMREDIYLKLNSVSIKEFDTRRYGDLLQLEIRDVENVSNGIFSIFRTLFQGVFTVVITIIMMLVANWILALGVILLSPLSVIVSYFVSSFNHKHFKRQAKLQSEVNSLSLEMIQNIDLVQSMNYEDKALERMKEIDKRLKKEGKTALFSASWVNPSTRLSVRNAM